MFVYLSVHTCIHIYGQCTYRADTYMCIRGTYMCIRGTYMCICRYIYVYIYIECKCRVYECEFRVYRESEIYTARESTIVTRVIRMYICAHTHIYMYIHICKYVDIYLDSERERQRVNV